MKVRDSASSPLVYIIDDDKEVLKALTWLLESVNLPVKCYENASDFLSQFNPQQCGCIVTDVRMPMISGLQLFAQLKEKNSHTPVIFLTGHGDIPMAVQMIKEGATDFISKPFNDQYLLEQIQKAISKNMSEQHSSISSPSRDLTILSRRERQVLELVVAGRLNKQIAEELCISNSTVEFHRAKIMRKLHAKNLAQLIKIYLKQ